MIHSPSWNERVFSKYEFPKLCDEVERAVREVRMENWNLKSIAASGNSGVPVAAVVAHRLGLGLIVVRQKGTSRHDSRDVNGWLENGSYVIVDDLIDSGKTIDRIIKRIHHVTYGSTKQPKPCTIVLHNAGERTYYKDLPVVMSDTGKWYRPKAESQTPDSSPASL